MPLFPQSLVTGDPCLGHHNIVRKLYKSKAVSLTPYALCQVNHLLELKVVFFRGFVPKAGPGCHSIVPDFTLVSLLLEEGEGVTQSQNEFLLPYNWNLSLGRVMYVE